MKQIAFTIIKSHLNLLILNKLLRKQKKNRNKTLKSKKSLLLRANKNFNNSIIMNIVAEDAS